MRIFLDANILFSAAKSPGAIRQLLHDLHGMGHGFVADGYVVEEARRNVSAKADASAIIYLRALLAEIDVSTVPYDKLAMDQSVLSWLPDKDRPVLAAAMALNCNFLVTGDRTHFGSGYCKAFGGVTIHSPAQLAELLLP